MKYTSLFWQSGIKSRGEIGERVERMGEMKSVYKILVRIPEKKRSFGGDSRKWRIT